MTRLSSKETAEIVGQVVAAATLPVRSRLAERLPYNQKEEMALGIGWWSVQQSFVERRSAASDGGSYNNKWEHQSLWQR